MNEAFRQIWPEWELLDELGRGAYGAVYKARRQDIVGTSYAAVKITRIPQNDSELDALRAEGMTNEQTRTYLESIVRDFSREIRMMERVRGYTNIVTIEDYRIVEHKDALRWDIYIRMELLKPLNQWMADHPMAERDIIRLGTDLCTALMVCRQASIVHRDIKPENIFVNHLGIYKLGDFGVSRTLERQTSNLSRKGTYNYLAPEVYNETLKSTDIDDAARTDICSLGLVLYRLANGGRLPFVPNKQLRTPADYRRALERRMSGEALPAPSGCSDALAAVILKAAAFNPAQRFESAEAMRAALMHLEPEIRFREAATSDAEPAPDRPSESAPPRRFSDFAAPAEEPAPQISAESPRPIDPPKEADRQNASSAGRVDPVPKAPSTDASRQIKSPNQAAYESASSARRADPVPAAPPVDASPSSAWRADPIHAAPPVDASPSSARPDAAVSRGDSHARIPAQPRVEAPAVSKPQETREPSEPDPSRFFRKPEIILPRTASYFSGASPEDGSAPETAAGRSVSGNRLPDGKAAPEKGPDAPPMRSDDLDDLTRRLSAATLSGGKSKKGRRGNGLAIAALALIAIAVAIVLIMSTRGA